MQKKKKTPQSECEATSSGALQPEAEGGVSCGVFPAHMSYDFIGQCPVVRSPAPTTSNEQKLWAVAGGSGAESYKVGQ